MKIYISGPITGTDDYMDRFAKMEEELKKEGWIVVNPARVNAQLPEQTTHKEYMMTSLAMLEMCDAIVMQEEWETSKGCELEFEYAVEHKIAILFEGGRLNG